ncbi:MAG: tRNA (adenosine(37)-N6)-dimethylallyltransferase MiaA [Flavobacteriales bacterium]|nr:tRNA (adenosine(37)-N6)-dimethylallyltransferase MiaA [Flavobacteriales bacterium]
MHPTLVVITGPTAVGKTKLCVEIAQHFDCDIISADSRQFFKELSIGTAKPTPEEMQNVIHHFVDSHSINTPYNVNDFEQDVLKLLPQLFKQNPIVILTGGSGLYIDAICDGFDKNLPQGDEAIRIKLEKLYSKYGIEILQEKLKQLDPIFYQEIDLSNLKRLYRAIEVCLLSGKPYSELRQGIKQKRSFNCIKIALNRDKEELYNRINLRVDLMLKEGLLEEVKRVEKYRNENALKTVGYRELFDFLDKKLSLEEAVEKIKVNTRRYAKKQIAWFNRNNDYKWFHPSEKDNIITYIKSQLKS